MDAKAAKRIDSLYRNMRGFKSLLIVSIIVPILMLFSLLLSLAYLYLRAKLLKDLDSGKIIVDDNTPQPAKPNELPPSQKIDFIRQTNGVLFAPWIITITAAIIIGVALKLT